MLQGQGDGQSGQELLSALVCLSTERVLQEALEHEQAYRERTLQNLLRQAEALGSKLLPATTATPQKTGG